LRIGEPSLSFVEESLNEICSEHSAAAVQMNAIGVKAPAIHLGHLIRALVQREDSESVTIE
jgi:hypothetical protein